METQKNQNCPMPTGGSFQCRYDTDWTLIHANDSLFQFLGYTKEEFQVLFHNQLSGVICREDMERVKQTIKEQLKQGNVILYEIRVICKRGSAKWVLISCEYREDGRGNPYFYGLFHAIRKQQQSQIDFISNNVAVSKQNKIITQLNNREEVRIRALKEIEHKNHQMQVILNAIQGGLKISLDDDAYTYVYVSDELCAMFGYTIEEYLKVTNGSAVGAVYPPDLKRVLAECENAFLNGNMDYAIKYRVSCKDGSLKWIIDSGKKVRLETGETIINSIYLDVTELEEANQKLAQQNEILDSIYDSIMCGILRFSLKGNEISLDMINREGMKLFGYQSEIECNEQGAGRLLSRICVKDRDVLYGKIKNLKKEGDRFQCEYRLLIPGQEVTWVYGSMKLLTDTAGMPVIQHIMIDISDKKKLELELEDERQRFRIAIENTPAIIFEYDIRTDTYNSYGTLEEGESKHNLERILPGYITNHMYSMIREPYIDAFSSLIRGKAGRELEFLAAPYQGAEGAVWAKAIVTPVYGNDGGCIRVIGKINNIQSEKNKEFELEEAKSRDGLTGLYICETGIRKVREYLNRRPVDQVCALMLLDMDDFGRVNEEEGSVFADAILQEVAGILCSESGKEDIKVRLGGDEFMLFVKDCDKSKATVIGPKIASMINGLFCQEERNIKISVSIGMCVTDVVDDYNGLYRCAESTLKYVKLNHKGHAACYLDTSNELGVMLTQLYTEEHTINEVNSYGKLKEADLISFALELLGKSKNLEDALYLLLARIGKYYHLDRVSVLETDYDYLSYRIAYQWSGNSSELQTGKEIYVNRDFFETVSQWYDEEGICENISGNSYIFPSSLHSAVWNQGIYAGSLIFEIHAKDYVWTSEHRKMVKELGRVIFSFILKAKADAISKAKTDFLSRVSHEIRTPMNAIIGMTAIAKTVLGDKERTMDCLNKIESANTYLLGLINDVLDMSRIESGKLELNLVSLNLKSQLNELEKLMIPQAEAKGVSLVIDDHTKPAGNILADGLRLSQVLINIIGNAVKFTNSGGHIVVGVRQESSSPDGLRVNFSVKDNGIGISKEAAGRIFNAFEQAGKSTSLEYGGTGLGLSISNLLVQMMGGILEVSSEVGKGSDFHFTLDFQYVNEPLEIQGQANPAADNRSMLMDFTGKRVLVAEDNELNLEIVTTILDMHGFLVEAAADGKQAVNLFRMQEPHYYDLVLMDIRMPIMDGLEATKQIRTLGKADSRSIPIIAMTANAFDEDTRKSMESGMNGHLAKPIEIDKLFALLKNCLT